MTNRHVVAVEDAERNAQETRAFLGLIKHQSTAYYVGRASMLSDDELMSVFAIAKAALRRCEAEGSLAAIPPQPKPAVEMPAPVPAPRARASTTVAKGRAA